MDGCVPGLVPLPSLCSVQSICDIAYKLLNSRLYYIKKEDRDAQIRFYGPHHG